MKNSKLLLGISLFGLALTGFGMMITRSGVVFADNYSHSSFMYTGIDNAAETVYSIGFWEKTKMILTGGSSTSIFHFSQIPVVVKSAIVLNAINDGIISNILGGRDMYIGNSHNITIIGGEGIVDQETVEDGNDNATVFGGKENKIQGIMNDTPTVLLGGKNNIVEPNHDANAIVGGSTNTIKQGAENVNILGGTSISISGDDVVAAGQQINGNVSDSFIFSDGQGTLDVNGSGMFFLKVANGVGFGSTTIEGNQGVISKGAVKVGTIDIGSTACQSDAAEHVGLIGLWHGCLVGCTSGSAAIGKWEMLGHSDVCRQICSQATECIPEKEPNSSSSVDYPSFCMGYVSTGRSHMCNSTGLDAYHNVIFETYLIDSDENCPNDAINQCAFQCNDGYHLTGDRTGQKSGDKMCYADCSLPWDSNETRKHNEVITGYLSSNVNCATEALFADACGERQLMCVDGSWYVDGRVYTGDVYQTCSLNQYTCNSSEYNLTYENIENLKQDTPHWTETGSRYGGHVLLGDRGMYQVCVDYSPTPSSNQSCTPDQYHYKFTGCNLGYSQVSDDGICRKQCTYHGDTIDHGGEITLYTCDTTTCPDKCTDHEKKFQCNDGTLYEVINGTISANTLNPELYNQTGCSVSGVVCDSSDYTIDASTYASIQGRGSFTSCTGYSVFDNSCVTGNVVYHLESCNANYYRTGDTCELCPTGYGSPAGSTGLDACVITCGSGEFVASYGGQCEPCGVGKYSTGNTVNATAMSWCSDCINKPDHADYISAGTNGPESCGWECDAGYIQEGNTCIAADYKDLEVYFLTNTGATGYYAMLDRNLGATAYMNEPGKTTGDWIGNYYQWGNNYGFPNAGSVKTSSIQVDASGYGPNNPYSSDTFIIAYSKRYSSEPQNHNLWGYTSNNPTDRQGPCPESYHVASMTDFMGMRFDDISDVLMPNTDMRWFTDGAVGSVPYLYGSGVYWSSTLHTYFDPYVVPIKSGGLSQDNTFVDDSWVGGDALPVGYGLPVRCFRDSQIPSMTLHPNGGTGAVIVVHDGTITKLGTPTRAGYTFEGWYSDSDFESGQVQIGQVVPTHLYAKWE